ncbi:MULTISPECIES: DUF5131 family protein [unclassified Paenibacillus]|uniref:DUF5131 family protein n=1 Tax=unclassified Paenibacillus TaxID=185978 RepID=UPI0030FD0D2E
MSDKTGIEWADATWNPVTGCTKVSEGCRNCYAKMFTERFQGTPGHYFETGFKVTLRPEKLDQPLRWRRPRRIFVNSMSDLFHPDVPDDYIDQVFAVMASCPEHTFQVLTKRPERMAEYFRLSNRKEKIAAWTGTGGVYQAQVGNERRAEGMAWPLPNVWLGVSVENQKAAGERIPLLLQTPAAVRFLSCEPLLGPVDMSKWLLTPGWKPSYYDPDNIHGYPNAEPTNEFINWVIVGGESGHAARPMNPDWARSLRDQCQTAEVSFFFKQWGEWAPGGNFDEHIPASVAYDFGTRSPDDEMVWKVGKKAAGRILDGRTWDEFPREGDKDGV